VQPRAGAHATRLKPHARTLGRAAQDNIFEWHFALRGPPDTEFQGGIYHGRIVLPPEYPFKPPTFSFLTVRAPGCACAPSLTPGLSRTGALRSTRRSASASAHTIRSTGSLPGACAPRWWRSQPSSRPKAMAPSARWRTAPMSVARWPQPRGSHPRPRGKAKRARRLRRRRMRGCWHRRGKARAHSLRMRPLRLRPPPSPAPQSQQCWPRTSADHRRLRHCVLRRPRLRWRRRRCLRLLRFR